MEIALVFGPVAALVVCSCSGAGVWPPRPRRPEPLLPLEEAGILMPQEREKRVQPR